MCIFTIRISQNSFRARGFDVGLSFIETSSVITNGSDETKSEDAEDCESDDREGGYDGRNVFEKPKSGKR